MSRKGLDLLTYILQSTFIGGVHLDQVLLDVSLEDFVSDNQGEGCLACARRTCEEQVRHGLWGFQELFESGRHCLLIDDFGEVCRAVFLGPHLPLCIFRSHWQLTSLMRGFLGQPLKGSLF